jgi:hypothetical protein
MLLTYRDPSGKRHEVAATITTNHATSSYGQPVIVLPDGGAVDLTTWILLNYQVVEATADEQEQLQRLVLRDAAKIAI